MFRGISSSFVRHSKTNGAWKGHVIADVCITPIGEGVSVRKHVVEVHEILRKFPGLRTKLHAYGTNVEGEWAGVMEAVRRAHEHLHESGVVRISSNMRFGTRTDKTQTLDDKTNNFPTSYSCCVVVNSGRFSFRQFSEVEIFFLRHQIRVENAVFIAAHFDVAGMADCVELRLLYFVNIFYFVWQFGNNAVNRLSQRRPQIDQERLLRRRRQSENLLCLLASLPQAQTAPSRNRLGREAAQQLQASSNFGRGRTFTHS